MLLNSLMDRLLSVTLCKSIISRSFHAAATCKQRPQTDEFTPPVVEGQSLPIITSRQIDLPSLWREPRQAWLESLSSVEDEKLGIVDLHPDVFATYPRIDLIHRNILWQMKYKMIKYDRVKTRAEMRGGGRKPWPQKGLGKARAGSIRSPLFKGGGVSHGPRGPESFYYMLTRSVRERGLRCTLSVKFAQNDLHVVDSLQLPSDEPEYIEELVTARRWGNSVLFVDDNDIIPKNMALAIADIGHFNAMPVYGLNVYSMLKHETLVLTLAAVERIEDKLVQEMYRPGRDIGYRDNVYAKRR